MNISFFPSKANDSNQTKSLLDTESNLSVDSSYPSSSFLNLIQNSNSLPTHEIAFGNLESNITQPLSFQEPKSWQEIPTSSIPKANEDSYANANYDSINQSNNYSKPNVDSASNHESNTSDNKMHEEENLEEVSEEELDVIDEEENLDSKINVQDESIFASLANWFQSLTLNDSSADTKTKSKEQIVQVLKKEQDKEEKSANKELAQSESKDINFKTNQQLVDWEKKVITSNDLFAKLSQAKSKNIEEAKSENKSNQDGKPLASKEMEKLISSMTQEVSGKNSKMESILVANKDVEKKSSTESKSKKEKISETSEKSETKDVPKLAMDRMEKGEVAKDIQKWEIRQEKGKQEFANTTPTSQNKEALNSLDSSSSSQSSNSQKDSSRDHSNEAFKSEMLKLNLTKKPDSLVAKSSVYDPEEMKANMDRLVQKAKIQIIQEGRSQAEIRLNPMELGRMILKISVHNDKVQGKVMVDSESVKTALQSDLSTLKEDLRAQGLDLQSLSIDVNLESHQDLQNRQENLAQIENFGNKNKKDALNEIDAPRSKRETDSLLDVIA